MPKILPTMTIGEILKLKPDALKIFEEHGLFCANCSLNTMETLAEGAKAHGLSENEIQDLFDKLSK